MILFIIIIHIYSTKGGRCISFIFTDYSKREYFWINDAWYRVVWHILRVTYQLSKDSTGFGWSTYVIIMGLMIGHYHLITYLYEIHVKLGSHTITYAGPVPSNLSSDNKDEPRGNKENDETSVSGHYLQVFSADWL